MVARNSRYWSEIQGQQYNFNRDEVEVAVLRRLTKEDLLKFYRTFVKRSPTRRKLSSQVLSTCDEEKRQRKNKPSREETQNKETPEESTCLVTDVVAFKGSLPLLPLAKPFAELSNFKRSPN